jgi:CBS-domain-containing membrane protein
MSTNLITITPNLDIARAAKMLLDNRVNGAPVVDKNGRLVGILCQSDLISQQKKLPIPTFFTFLDISASIDDIRTSDKRSHC